MTLSDAAAGLTLLALIAYAVLAGADFGGGVWDLFASGPRRDAQREAIAHAIGPVWEANHVWLIFAIVLTFSCFPPAFAALGVGLYLPLHLVLVGITLRGAAYVFRAYGADDPRARRRWGAVFGASSAVTPWLLGACLAILSNGALRVRGGVVEAPRLSAWFGPLPLTLGALALAACAYAAAVFLAVETDAALREDFRRRALASGTAVVALSALAVPVLHAEAPRLASSLVSSRALPIVLAGALSALASGAALYAGRVRAARVASIAWIALELAGWSVAQYPFVIAPDVTFAATAAPDATIRFVLASTAPGFALLLPSLWLLFRVFKSRPRP
ncbi:MAG: cytochrome d ubiquinol oxidase subunit II [Polyangiales bacterium]